MLKSTDLGNTISLLGQPKTRKLKVKLFYKSKMNSKKTKNFLQCLQQPNQIAGFPTMPKNWDEDNLFS